MLRIVIATAQVVSALGIAAVATLKPPELEPLVGAPETAAAHNLQMEISFIALDPSSQPLFESRVQNSQPLIQTGDIITIVFGGLNFIGTVDGMGGYFDFYPVTGTQVVNAEYVKPVPGGFAPIPIKKAPAFGTVIATSDPTGQLKNFTLGPNINGLTSKPSSAANANLGTLYGFYGDTGIFYSTDPRTAYGSWGSVTSNVVNNRGDKVNDVPVTHYDVEQLRALGMSAPATCIFDSVCRGDGPWGLGSPVAGPESGYQWQFRITNTLAAGIPTYSIEPGPFRRIQYPGSQVSNDTPGNLSLAVFDTSLDASSTGFALSPATPLSATSSWSDNTSPKVIRFAVGRIFNGAPEYARVAIRVNDPSSILLPSGCPPLTAMAFSGDAGISSGGKDILWRYFNPTQASWSPCLTVFKQPSKPTVGFNETFTYSLKAFNTGVQTLTNVTIQDTLPAGLTFVSAVPAATGTNPQTWSVGQINPNSSWSAVITVKGTSTGVFANTMVMNTDQGAATTQAIVGVAIPVMNETKSVAPAAVSPGSTVTYTINLNNTGTGASSTPIKVYETLPAGFTFTGLKSVIVNGADVTSGSSAAGTRPVTISLPSALAIQPGQQAVIVFTAQVSTQTTAGTYCNNFSTAYGSATSSVAATACVTVASSSIGDAVWRDWNGNGVQDTGEEGAPGIVVSLTNSSGVNITTTTNANGAYLFNGLIAGTYTVTVGTPAGYTVTGDPVGPLDGRATYTLGSSTVITTADFGLQPGGAGVIGDQVFNDVGFDGGFDAGTDTNIPNVTVWLYEDSNGNGVIDTGDLRILTTTTTASGLYTFTNLATGLSYIARVDSADADLVTYFNPNSYVASTLTSIVVPNLTSTPVLTADFGFWA
ncbi:MAG: SdrD B-like domain-containing protein, partial [Thermoflexales bacterium]